MATVNATDSSIAFLDRRLAGSAWFRYSAPVYFSAGWLVIEDERRAVRTVALQVGTFAVAGFSAGVHRVWAVAWSADDSLVSVAAPIRYVHTTITPASPFQIGYRTDLAPDWREGSGDATSTRTRLALRQAGHWFQWRLRHDRQGQRIVLRNTQLEVFTQGMSPSAKEA